MEGVERGESGTAGREKGEERKEGVLREERDWEERKVGRDE